MAGRSRFGRMFVEGVREAAPVLLAVLPFALVFGATAAQSGYSLAEAVFASATIFAGASQFVFLEVNGLGVPAWSVVLAVFAVNFRHILYSASIGRFVARFGASRKYAAFFFLTDLQWAAGEARIRAAPQGFTPGWYFGYAATCYVFWVGGTFAGAYFGALIRQPERYGLDFLIPIYFLIILMGFRRRRNFLPIVAVSGAASFGALLVLGEPWHISIGAIAGVAAAALLPPGSQGEAGHAGGGGTG